MKGFKFALEPLLRLKEVEKRKIELELANHQAVVKKHEEQLASEEQSIRDMLNESEYEVSKNHRSVCLMSYSFLIQQKKENIYLLQKQIEELAKKTQGILHRLNVKSNELKQVEEEKEEKRKQFKRKFEKQEQANADEIYSILRNSKENEVLP